jgi:hypothetical protein
MNLFRIEEVSQRGLGTGDWEIEMGERFKDWRGLNVILAGKLLIRHTTWFDKEKG